MANDYRNTKYCSEYGNIKLKKESFEQEIKKIHPRIKDIHTLISKNNEKYKTSFMGIYNFKCAYCGTSVTIIPRSMFQIDHFKYQKSKCFHGSKAEAGKIENLVLACQFCNHRKSAFEISESGYDSLYPDLDGIKSTFVRDEQYYIRISDEKQMDSEIVSFYNKLQLGAEIHRVDYLLMSMIGLYNKMNKQGFNYSDLLMAIERLKEKRNLMITSVMTR